MGLLLLSNTLYDNILHVVMSSCLFHVSQQHSNQISLHTAHMTPTARVYTPITAGVTNLHAGMRRHVEQRPVDDVGRRLDACPHYVLHRVQQLVAGDVVVRQHRLIGAVRQGQPRVHQVPAFSAFPQVFVHSGLDQSRHIRCHVLHYYR